jgi:hypothetical protein
MTSHLFPSPHSCTLCQNLILYRRDAKWWEKVIESSSEVSENFRVRLSDKVKQWLISQLGGESKLQESGRKKSYTIEKLWTSLEKIVIFDYTIAEGREGGATECNLFNCLIGDNSSKSDDKLFLAAKVSEVLDNYMYFGHI